MKSYSQVNKKKPFDWNAFLDKAIKGKTTEKENWKATKLAMNWVTCACGNQCDVIDRLDDGCPKDDDLEHLGHTFFHDIEDENWKEAKQTLKEIEKRSAFLINQKAKQSIDILKKLGYKVTKA